MNTQEKQPMTRDDARAEVESWIRQIHSEQQLCRDDFDEWGAAVLHAFQRTINAIGLWAYVVVADHDDDGAISAIDVRTPAGECVSLPDAEFEEDPSDDAPIDEAVNFFMGLWDEVQADPRLLRLCTLHAELRAEAA